MKLIKALIQKNIEYSQMNPENAESLIAITHAYALTNAIENDKKNPEIINGIYKACLKLPKESRAMKIQPFTAKMMARIDEFIGKMNIEKDMLSSSYDAIDFHEMFDTFGTEIQDLE